MVPKWSVVTECAYLIPHLYFCSDLLITKRQISRVLYGYSDKTWYVGSGGHKYYQLGLSSLNAHTKSKYLIYIFVLIGYLQKRQISRVLYGLQYKAWYVGSSEKYCLCALSL